MNKHRLSLLAVSLVASLCTFAQLPNIPMEKGKFDNNWESLRQWDCPEWFKDAKFGLWAHWGPQCQAESGDWYARFMYDTRNPYDEHRATRYNPAEYGFKEYIRDWKAEKFDPKAIVKKYKAVGCKYFMALANHHDNMDLWDSPYQEWNSVNLGPKRDICAGWAEAVREEGLKFGMSVHASHAWTWYELGRKYGDVRLTKADGKGQWWEGYDPNELYAQAHDNPSTGWQDKGRIHSQWEWNNGASIPDEAYRTKLQNRCRQMVNALHPDMIYFDDTVLPFYGCDNQWGQDFLAYYYNHMSNLNGGGDPSVVVMGKILPDLQKECMLWDVERGIPDRPRDIYWQTCTCIGGWHYSIPDYKRGAYKSASTVIRMLVDIVSKNGNLLLSVPLKGDGTYDEKEARILDDIEAWMKINGESIYGTRYWKACFGEGPLTEATNAMKDQGFNEGQSYTSQEVRYVTKGSDIYATIMVWPEAGEYTFKAFSPLAQSYCGQVSSVYLLGYGEVPFRQGASGLVIDVPATHPNEIAPAFRISFKEGQMSDADKLKMITADLDLMLRQARKQSSVGNSGTYNTLKIDQLSKAVKQAKKISSEQLALEALTEAYQDFVANGKNREGQWGGAYASDLTASLLVQPNRFERAEGGSLRFGKPAHWSVDNFSIPNGADGVKQGLDMHTGKESLMLGVWNDRDSQQGGHLRNARIYRKVRLQKGRYFFGATYQVAYSLSEAYMFVSAQLCDTPDIPSKSLAHYSIGKAGTDGKLYGLWVSIPKDMDVYVGFQADLSTGSATQEFRAENIALYRLE